MEVNPPGVAELKDLTAVFRHQQDIAFLETGDAGRYLAHPTLLVHRQVDRAAVADIDLDHQV